MIYKSNKTVKYFLAGAAYDAIIISMALFKSPPPIWIRSSLFFCKGILNPIPNTMVIETTLLFLYPRAMNFPCVIVVNCYTNGWETDRFFLHYRELPLEKWNYEILIYLWFWGKQKPAQKFNHNDWNLELNIIHSL